MRHSYARVGTLFFTTIFRAHIAGLFVYARISPAVTGRMDSRHAATTYRHSQPPTTGSFCAYCTTSPVGKVTRAYCNAAPRTATSLWFIYDTPSYCNALALPPVRLSSRLNMARARAPAPFYLDRSSHTFALSANFTFRCAAWIALPACSFGISPCPFRQFCFCSTTTHAVAAFGLRLTRRFLSHFIRAGLKF